MLKDGNVFSHYAYVTREQVEFKCAFYGYTNDGIRGWEELQNVEQFPVYARDYFIWLNEGSRGYEPRFYSTMIDEIEKSPHGHIPLVELKESYLPVCKRKIVVDGASYDIKIGGITRVWDEVFHRVVNLSEESCFYFLVRGKSVVVNKVEGVQYINMPPYTSTARDQYWLYNMLHTIGADVFISTYHTSPILKPEGVKIVYLLHDLTPELFEWGWIDKQNAVMEADRIVCVSEVTCDKLEQIYGKYGVASMNGINTDIFTRSPISASQPYLLMVGQRGGYKSGHVVFQTLKAMCDIVDGLCPKLVIVGGGPLTSEELSWAGEKLEVEYKGNVDDVELVHLYSTTKALIMLSLDEGFGLPVIEALACGSKVIVSDIEIFRWLVGKKKGEWVKFVNPGLMESVSGAIIDVIETPEDEVVRKKVIAEVKDRYGNGWDSLARDVAKAMGVF
jgi:glycosyltransferase involved in cell wall biosynthesis